jgi:RNA polymerase sigma-70 factor, ECF subfamily
MSEQNPIVMNCDVPALWEAHKTVLKNYIRKRIKDEDVAKDILQDILMKVYQFCLSKSGVRNVRAWLFQIAHNIIIDYQRKQNKLSYEVPEMIEIENETKAYEAAAEFILPMIQFLPEAYAIPLKLADIDGLKQADIAQKLGLSLTATKSRIQRARQLLKSEFITCCHFETDKNGQLLSFAVKDNCAPLQAIIKRK